MRKLVKISTLILLVVLAGLSLRRPATGARSVSLLMEPDGAGVWRALFDEFQKKNPDTAVEFVEGPPSTNTREDMYSTAFLAGGGGFDVIYSDVIWIPKFAAAGWLLDLTERIAPSDREDF